MLLALIGWLWCGGDVPVTIRALILAMDFHLSTPTRNYGDEWAAVVKRQHGKPEEPVSLGASSGRGE